jgi:hypothetical protein
VTGRVTLYLLLTVVAGAAAMLSFAALRDLALRCGFEPVLAWLLPVVVDAGAAAGSLVWLRDGAADRARRFACRLALGLLALSVAANALGHGLAAYVLLPPWWVVVILSGIAPAVLGAMVHLAVLVGHSASDDTRPDLDDEPIPYQLTSDPDVLDGHGLSYRWGDAPTAAPEPAPDRAAELIAAGAGRRRLSRELDITEYEARRLLEAARPATSSPADARPGDPALNGASS